MENKLIDESERRELLEQRASPLTKGQRRELREIERIGFQMGIFLDDGNLGVIDGEEYEVVWESLRNQQREILMNERKGILEKLASLIPDGLSLRLG